MEAIAYSFDISTPVSFSRTGKMKALTEEWTHPTSHLSDFELIIVTQNTLYIQYENKKYTVPAGEYLLLQPQHIERIQNKSAFRKGFQKSECTFYWLHFRCLNVVSRNVLLPDSIHDGYDNILIPVQGLLKYPEKVLLLLIRLQDSLKNGYSSYYLNLLSTLILCEISNQHILQISQKRNSKKANTEKVFNDIKDYVAYYINKDIKISDVATHFNYSDKYISRLFKQYSGSSLKKYILEQKMKKANFLLLDTNLSVKEIAEHLGFSNYHAFEMCYKKYNALSPTEYKNLFSNRITNYG